MPIMSPENTAWIVGQAREALTEGHRVVAAHLNAVLAEKAPSVRVETEPLQNGDSLTHAAKQFRLALQGLRVIIRLNSNDCDVPIWTLGYINDRNNNPCFITPCGIHGNTGDFDLDGVCAFLLKRDWPTERWKDNIQEPVVEHYLSWLAVLQQGERD